MVNVTIKMAYIHGSYGLWENKYNLNLENKTRMGDHQTLQREALPTSSSKHCKRCHDGSVAASHFHPQILQGSTDPLFP